MRYFIGIDVGGTTTTIGVGTDRREVVHVAPQFSPPLAKGPQAVVAAIAQQALACVETVGAAVADVAAVGLATPGPATADGVLLKTPNLDAKDWDRFPIRGELERELQRTLSTLRVHYLGDGQAAALGEYSIRNRGVTWSRVAEGDLPSEKINSLFMAIVGTGLGGGAVRDGVAIRGSEGRAGHVGHLFLPFDAFRYDHDRHLRVGNAYCTAESAISLTGLTHQLEYRLSLKDWRGHRLQHVEGSIRDKAKLLRQLAAEGDELALELFEDQARALGIALLTVNYLGDFDRLVIGGGVCDLVDDVRENYRKLAEESYREHALDGFRNLDRFEFSLCGDDAPVIGALAWVMALEP